MSDAVLPTRLSAKDASLLGAVAYARNYDSYFDAVIAASCIPPASTSRRKQEEQSIASGDQKAALVNTAAERCSCRVFPPIAKPQRGDWLDEHHEAGQSVSRFLERSCQYAKPHGPYDTIAIVIIGEGGFPSELVAQLREYISAFFLLPVTVVGPMSIEVGDGKSIRRRQHPDTGLQLFASDCLDFAKKVVSNDRKLSRRVVATMGITMLDLTKDENWNFLYGLASSFESSGCFSMCRFSPSFNGEKVSSAAETAKTILNRCCKVVTHELTHIFGVKHCVHFQCLMNGANHCGELARQPLLECPVCCKKLTLQLGWDLAQRFTRLGAVLESMEFVEDASFVQSELLQRVTALCPAQSTAIGSTESASLVEVHVAGKSSSRDCEAKEPARRSRSVK